MKRFPAYVEQKEYEEIYEACREYLKNVEIYLKLPKKQILDEVFKIKDIRHLKSKIKKYKWGVLEALESYIQFPAYLFKKQLFSARVPAGSQDIDTIKNNALLIKKAVTIQEIFDQIFKKEPDLNFFKELWQKKFIAFIENLGLRTENKISLKDFEEFLAKGNIFIFYFRGATISGLATKNFIFINNEESKARQYWTLFHELLHLLNKDFAFRTPRDKKEAKHEEEVGRFLIEDFLPKPVENISIKEIDQIAEQIFKNHPLKLHKYAIKKWISKKIGKKLKYERFNKKSRKQPNRNFILIPSQSYLQLIEPIKNEDLEIYASLQGLSLEELLTDNPGILEF